VRTLVVSDFHLGAGVRHAVLEWPRPRERLLAALPDVDRLVLLGDTVELLTRPPAHALVVAEPVLRAVADRLPATAEIVLVPGNHDRELIAPWLRRRGRPLEADTAVPLEASSELELVGSWLGSDRLRVHYPGVWLDDATWATHGHYLDRHLLPDSSWGVTRGLLGRRARETAAPDDYERKGGRSLDRLQGRLPAVLHGPAEALLDLARAATMPSAAPSRLLSPRMARLTAPVLGLQMRRASIPALVHVVRRLGVSADTVIFGHVHRLGPLAADDPSEWRDPTGEMAIFNCGSWIYEPLLLHHVTPPHPYWPGGAVLVEDGGPPRAVGLLDGLTLEDMRRAVGRRRSSRR
jgi:predicted phosphodiesterase